MDEEKLKELADSIYDKLNDEEKFYLLWVNHQKNKEIERLNKELFDITEKYRKIFKEKMELIREL